jgi:Flp pilus assembly protein TadB
MGTDGPATRQQLGEALDVVADGLRAGQAVGGAWQMGAVVATLDGDGREGQQVVRAVADVATGLSGAAILAFCQRIHLDPLFEEEEWEETALDYPG